MINACAFGDCFPGFFPTGLSVFYAWNAWGLFVETLIGSGLLFIDWNLDFWVEIDDRLCKKCLDQRR